MEFAYIMYTKMEKRKKTQPINLTKKSFKVRLCKRISGVPFWVEQITCCSRRPILTIPPGGGESLICLWNNNDLDDTPLPRQDAQIRKERHGYGTLRYEFVKWLGWRDNSRNTIFYAFAVRPVCGETQRVGSPTLTTVQERVAQYPQGSD